MKIRSHMVVHDVNPEKSMVYVLVEGVVGDCAVYMKEVDTPTTRSEEAGWLERFVADTGGKVSIRDIDALPFRIPSHLTYRA